MVVTKITKRKRKQPEWLKDDDNPILDLTEDEDESKSVSISGFDSSEDERKSTLKTVGSSFDREILSGDQEDDNLLSSSLAKNSPIAKSTRVEVQSPTDTELENQIKRDASQIVLPVESIQPPIKIDRLYLKFSAQAVEVRGGDNKENMIYEWPLENIVRIGIHYLSEDEEDTRAFVAVRVSVPLFSLSGSGKEIDECLLQLPNFRDSVVDISKLSPIFGGIIEELKKEDVEKTARTLKMQNSQASTSLFSSSSEELDEAIDAFKVLVYPQGDPDAVTITQKDIKILKPFEFINDTIIDFYIKYLQQTIVSSEKLKTLHFFNSFFFSKLAEVDAGGAAAFERVKKWTRKVNVFEKDFVFIPVNQSLHWSLIIICHPGHMWDVSTINESSDGDACILHLDSMEGCHRGVEAHIRNYLFQEWIARNKDPEDMPYAEEFFSGMPYRYSKVPQQDNNCDCGLFLLHYVELFLTTAPSVFRTKRQRSPPTQFLRRNWFKPSEASAKRRVIQKLILELSQGRSLENLRDFTEVKENALNGMFPAEELTRALSTSLRGDNQSASQSSDELGPVHSDPLHQVKEPLIENCPYARSEEVELHDDLGRFLNSDRQDELVRLQHVDVSTEDGECDDIHRGMHHIGSDQPNVSCKSRADQSSAHVSVNDDLKSEPEAVIFPDGETWNHEKCPVPRLPLQVKPLQIPTLLDEQVQLYYQPSAAVDLRIQAGSETSDDLSSSFVNGDARSQKGRPLLEFDSILSPEEVNLVTAGNDDEMYESSPFAAKQRWSTSHLQPEVVSPVIGTPEHVRFTPVRSPESLDALPDDYSKKGGRTVERTVESGRRPVRFWNKTLPFGRCSELNMQSALNCGQRKHTEDRGLARKDSHQPYGFSVYSEEVQEIEELSSDDSSDSSDSSKRWDFEKRTPELNVKRSSIEIGQRVTRSKTQSSHGLPLSTEKQARKDALEALCKQKDSRR